jgi:hypothetical protein
MAKDPRHRHPDALALAEDLEDVREGRSPRHTGEEARRRAAATWSAQSGWPDGAGAHADDSDSPLAALVEDLTPTGPVHAASALAAAAQTQPVSRGRRQVPTALAAVIVGGGALALGVAAFVAYRMLSHEGAGPGSPAPSPVVATSPAGEPRDGEPPPAGGMTGPSAAPPSAPPARGGSPKPRATAVPPSGPRSSAAPSSAPVAGALAGGAAETAAALKPGKLRLEFEHPLKSGRLRVWLDGALVLEQDLSAEAKRKALVFRVNKGVVEETVDVAPGPHTVRIEVRWEDEVRAKNLRGVFRSGQTRTADANLSRLRKVLDLEWK